VNYAFVIDNRRCIGCHACSVACKVEHSVPLGVARTWVKYVEKGVFPETRRTFTVTRCNHCEDAPCVEICPTTALYKRSDGIVDFDPKRCIGCKGCMQACPYDALYIDPATETAAKCNFCAHRVEVGLEPPCVTVCPTQAIVAGDLDDPASRVNHLRFREPVQVRKPEKGTRPKVFYVEGDAAALVPAAAPPPSDYMWSQAAGPMALPLTEEAGAPRRTFGVKEQHRNSWGFRVSAYLWTKSLAAGAFLVPALLALLHREEDMDLRGPALVAMAFLGLTGLLLVTDLRRPERFLWTLTRPQWRSWLTRGAYIITAYGGILGFAYLGAVTQHPLPPWALMVGILLALGSAVYTAFLFGQSKGRDLWQSPLLAPHLAVQALVAGAALFAPSWLLFLVPIHGLFVAAEIFGRHPTEDARRAAHLIEQDPVFTTGVLVLGHLLPLVLLWGAQGPAILARVLLLAGLLFWEHLYVQAPQMVPNA
jgi:Fe-S-cluster-containing dehydrogenase component/formate-dependent nitrite reductase membrane component NrfD